MASVTSNAAAQWAMAVDVRVFDPEVAHGIAPVNSYSLPPVDSTMVQHSWSASIGPTPADPQFSNNLNIEVTFTVVGYPEGEPPQIYEIAFLIAGMDNWRIR